MDWFGTIRGRIGWTNDRLMVYATAGAAYTELDRGHRGRGLDWHSTYGWGVSDFHDDSDDVNWGFVGGGGIEWLWAPNLSFKAEALWIDFESGDNDRLFRFHGSDGSGPVTWERRKRFDHDDDMVVVRVGLNWKFGHRAPPPYEPLK